jgi:hypothetical protein
MTAPNELLRQVLRNVSFCQALPAGALEPQLIQQVTEITGISADMIFRLGRLVATNGSLLPLQLLIKNGHIDKAPGLRYHLRVHSKLGGLGQSEQEARQGIILVVASSRGRIKLTMTVSLRRASSANAAERRMARVKWVWVFDTQNQRQVRRHSFIIGGASPNGHKSQRSKSTPQLAWPMQPRI